MDQFCSSREHRWLGLVVASSNVAQRFASRAARCNRLYGPKERVPMAEMDQTNDWTRAYAPSLAEFESLAREAFARLPDEFRALTGDVIIRLDDFPSDEIFEDMALETPFDLLGLFEGRGVGERFSLETGEFPNRITLYRRPILDYWAENEETLGDIIAHVLIHEIGHHFGLSDDDMERIEETVD
jgi:predicted Zn-dependent protease with MMP-like domain